jgi:hypothetical protein
MEQYGGAKKPKKTSTIKSKKVPTSSSSKTTKTRSKVKGGNFIGAVGDLVAPTGWGPFVTAAGLLALDRADAALRRKTKKEKMKGGKKIKGGECKPIPISDKTIFINNLKESNANNLKTTETLQNYDFFNPKYILSNQYLPEISINCLKENEYKISIKIFCNGEFLTYNFNRITYTSLEDAKNWLSNRHNQLLLIGLALNSLHDKCKNPDYLTSWQKSQLPIFINNKKSNRPIAQRPGIVRTSKTQRIPYSSKFPEPPN